MNKTYDAPKYYEIAFSFMNVKRQIDSFEKIIKKFSKIKVKTFLDVACGPSLQLREIAKRGYGAIGLDLSNEMLKYLQKKANEKKLKIQTIKADMYNFKLDKKADFAYILLGSLTPKSNENLLSHLNSVASSLNKGGLYLIQNHMFEYQSALSKPQTWVMKNDGIIVKTTYNAKMKNIPGQIIQENISLEINDNGKKRKFSHKKDLKTISPQEFKLLVEKNGKFEFIGWFPGDCNTWWIDKKLENAKDANMNMILLRKK